MTFEIWVKNARTILSRFIPFCLLLSPFLCIHAAKAQGLSWSNSNDLTALPEISYTPVIVLSSDGTKATAIWIRFADGTRSELVTASAVIVNNVPSWGNRKVLSLSGSHPTLALSSDGTRATAIWNVFDEENGSTSLYSASASIVENTASWGTISKLVSSPMWALEEVHLALSDDGTKATATWHDFRGSTSTLQSASAAIDGNNASWSDAVNLSPSWLRVDTSWVSTSPDGTRLTAVWAGKLNFVSTEYFIQSASGLSNGASASWGAVSELSTSNEQPRPLQVHLSDDGAKATVIWSSFRTAHIKRSTAAIEGSAATWSSVAELSVPWGSFADPQLSLSRDGTKISAIWIDRDNAEEFIRSASGTIGENTVSWDSIADLSARWQTIKLPQIFRSSDGTRATAFWVRRPGPYDGESFVQSTSAKVIGKSLVWSPAIDISSAGQYADNPQASVSLDGTYAIAIWGAGGTWVPYDKRIIRYAAAMADSDRDGTSDEYDGCIDDPAKTSPGECGCGLAETGCSPYVATPQATLAIPATHTPTPTEIPIATPTSTATVTATVATEPTTIVKAQPPTATPVGTAGKKFRAPRVRVSKIKSENASLIVTVNKIKKPVSSIYVVLVDMESETLFKRAKVKLKDGTGKVSIKNVTHGRYRIYSYLILGKRTRYSKMTEFDFSKK